jgi:hypothetical protein
VGFLLLCLTNKAAKIEKGGVDISRVQLKVQCHSLAYNSGNHVPRAGSGEKVYLKIYLLKRKCLLKMQVLIHLRKLSKQNQAGPAMTDKRRGAISGSWIWYMGFPCG